MRTREIVVIQELKRDEHHFFNLTNNNHIIIIIIIIIDHCKRVFKLWIYKDIKIADGCFLL